VSCLGIKEISLEEWEGVEGDGECVFVILEAGFNFRVIDRKE